MSDWSYVAIAYTVVWGGLAGYGLLLARRVYQANVLDRQLKALAGSPEPGQEAACDDDVRPPR